MAECDLDPIQRRLIDEAVAAGRVRVIPAGVSGLPEDGSLGCWRRAGPAALEKHRRAEALKVAKRRELAALRAEKPLAPHTAPSPTTAPPTVAEPKPQTDPQPGGDTQADAPCVTTDPTQAEVPRVDKAAVKRDRAAAHKRTQLKPLRDRRRFKTGPVPLGQALSLPEDHGAVSDGRTLFPRTVLQPDTSEPVLRDGSLSVKVGGDVLVGHLKGARLYTLTLEERATCPRACSHWRSCYGNRMSQAKRWRHGPEFEASLKADLARVCDAGKPVLVRIHILGDFYSLDYVHLWFEALDKHRELHVFGFSAWDPETEIGEAVADVRAVFGTRFAVRHSGRTGPWGSFTVDFPTDGRSSATPSSALSSARR